MSSLRSRVIRLASTNPDLRPILLPLLKAAAKAPVIPKNVKAGDTLEVEFLDEGERSHEVYTVLDVVIPGKELKVEDERGRKSTFDIDYTVVSVEIVAASD